MPVSPVLLNDLSGQRKRTEVFSEYLPDEVPFYSETGPENLFTDVKS